jgi:hypothetical protein
MKTIIMIVVLAAITPLTGCVHTNNAMPSPDNHFPAPYAPKAPS